MNKCGIYCIVSGINGKRYIGSSSRIKKRWAEHKSTLKYNKHCNPILQRSYNKYGKDNFTYEIIEECDVSLLVELEDKYMEQFKTLNRKYGYNIELASRPNQSPESNEKRRIAGLGRVVSKETRKRLSEALKGENNPMFGKKHSKEAIKKISDSLKGENNNMFGKTHSEEARKKTSDSMKGEKNWTFGKPLSEEHKANQRAGWAKRKQRLLNEAKRKSGDL